MSLKHFTIGIVLAVCTFAAQAAAQEAAHQNEVSGTLGRIFISDKGILGAPSYDPNLRYGKGLTFEIDYARRLMDGPFWSIAVEVPFVVNVDEDIHAAQNVRPLRLLNDLRDSCSTLESVPRTRGFSLGEFWWRIQPFRPEFHARVWRN